MLKIKNSLSVKVLLNLIIRVIGTILSFAFSILIIRHVGSAEVGFYQVSLAFANILSVWVGFGSETYILKEASKTVEIQKNLYFLLFSILFSVGILFLSIIIFIVLRSYSIYFGLEFIGVESGTLIFFIIFSIFISLLLNNFCQTIGKSNLATFVISFLIPLLNLLQIGVFSYTSFDKLLVFYLCSSFLSILLLAYIVLSTCLKLQDNRRGILCINNISHFFIKFLQSTKIRSQFLMISIFGILFVHVPTLILNYHLPIRDVTYYNYTLKLVSLLSFPLSSANSHIASKISYYFNNKNLEAVKETYFKSIKLLSIVVVLPVITLWFFGGEIVHLFGKDFNGLSYLIRIFIIGQIFNILCGSNGVALSMMGKQKINLYNSVMVGGVSMLLLFPAIAYFGIIGAAYVYTFRLSLWNIVGLIFVLRTTQACNK